MLAAPAHALKRIHWVPAARPDAHGVSEADLANLIPLNDPVEAPSSAGMTRSAHKAHGRAGHAGRKELFRAEDLSLQWREMRKAGVGLQNLGNTCFMNSVLQSLVHTPPLAELLLSAGSGRLHNGAVNGFYPIQLAKELVSRSLAHGTRSPLAPMNFAKSLRRISRSFRLGRQEDAHEFLIALLDAMHEASIAGLSPKPPPEVAHTSFIYRIFGGRMRSQVKCSECGYESNTYDPCIDLSLEITRAQSVRRALERFTAGEVLDGQNKYKCPKQNKGVRAIKRMSVDAAPNVLMIQLKRFEFSFSGHKISKKVDFELELDLGPYMSERPAVPAVYDLYAVLVHSGHSVHSGHYYAYVRAPNGIWHICDDTHVAQVAERQVMAQKAYILFYLKRQPGGRAPPPASARGMPQPSPAAAAPAARLPNGVPKRAAGPAPASQQQQRRQDVQQAAVAVQQQQQQGPSLKRKREAEAAPVPRPRPQQQQAEQQQRLVLSPEQARISKKPRLKGLRKRGEEEAAAAPHLVRKRLPPPSPLVGLGGVIMGRRGARLAEVQAISAHPASRKLRRKSAAAAAAARAEAAAQAEAPYSSEAEGAGGSVTTSVVSAPDWPPVRQAAAGGGGVSEQERAVLKQQRRRQRQQQAEEEAAQRGAAGPAAASQQQQQPASVQAFLRRSSGGTRLSLESWEEAPASVKQLKAALQRKELPKRKRVDEYDAEYDRGRTKKVRSKPAPGGEVGGVDGASFDAAWAAKQRSGVQTQLRGSRKRRSADFKQQQRGRGRPPSGPRSPGGGQRRSFGGGGRR